MSTIIVTGFEPFGPYKANPTAEIAESFNGDVIDGDEIIGIVLECTYKGAFQTLQRAIHAAQPAAVISTGLSSSAPGIQFETIGRNRMNGKYPDADGFAPKGEKTVADGPEFIAAHSNASALANRLHKKGIVTATSADAGGFVCDALLYQTSLHITRNRSQMRNAFIHTPWTTDHAHTIQLEPGKIMLPREVVREAIIEIVRGVLEE